MNIVILKGRTTAEIDLRQTQSGVSVAKFTLAVDRRGKDGAKSADFISCVAWRQTADILSKYVRKGQEILVYGTIRKGSYEKNGEKKYTTDVYVDSMEFCGSKSANTQQGTQTAPQTEQGSNNIPDPLEGIVELFDDVDAPF